MSMSDLGAVKRAIIEVFPSARVADTDLRGVLRFYMPAHFVGEVVIGEADAKASLHAATLRYHVREIAGVRGAFVPDYDLRLTLVALRTQLARLRDELQHGCLAVQPRAVTIDMMPAEMASAVGGA